MFILFGLKFRQQFSGFNAFEDIIIELSKQIIHIVFDRLDIFRFKTTAWIKKQEHTVNV